MNETLRKELISAAITFISAFLIGIGGELSVNGFTTFTASAIFALLMAGVRAGVKGLSTLVVK